jgi:aspartate/methionine/tyrosine aminotransferase
MDRIVVEDVSLAELKAGLADGSIALIDVRGTGLSAHDFAWGLYRAEGVSVLDASAFGPAAAGHVRVAFTVSEAELDEAARRILRFTKALTRRGAA